MVKLWWTTWTPYFYKHGKGTWFLPLDRMKYPTLGPIFQHPSEIDTCTSHFAKLQLKILQCQWPMQWTSAGKWHKIAAFWPKFRSCNLLHVPSLILAHVAMNCTISLVFCLCFCIARCVENCSQPENSLLQIQSVAPRWRSARDLAFIPAPQMVNLTGSGMGTGMQFQVISAVPTFGPLGNFIALILEHNLENTLQMMDYKKLNESMTRSPIFCSGPNGAHLVQLRLFGHLICDWPADEMDQEEFQVFIQDADGKTLANIFTSRKPQLLKQYHTLACVRDVFEEVGNPEEQFSGPYKQFVEWLEYSLLHGIDHFLAYTFQGTDSVTDLLAPYIESGRATRIHFMEYHKVKTIRFRRVLHDCLFRAKNHATWLLASVDIDEYIRVTPDVYAPNFLNSMWDAFLEKEQLHRDQIHSFQLSRYRFARSHCDQVEVTSTWREPKPQRKLRHRRAEDEFAPAPGKLGFV